MFLWVSTVLNLLLYTVGVAQMWCSENSTSGNKKGTKCPGGGLTWPEAQYTSIKLCLECLKTIKCFSVWVLMIIMNCNCELWMVDEFLAIAVTNSTCNGLLLLYYFTYFIDLYIYYDPHCKVHFLIVTCICTYALYLVLTFYWSGLVRTMPCAFSNWQNFQKSGLQT